MILKYSVINDKYCRTHHHENVFPGYYNTQAVIDDFEKVMEFHQLKYDKFKKDYIEKHGQDSWAKYIIGEE